MTIHYNIVSQGEGQSTITAFIAGSMYTCDSTHPEYANIVTGLLNGEESVADLFSMAKVVADRFERLSDRVSVTGSQVLFDGDAVDNALTQQIIRFIDAGVDDWMPLVNFFERVAANPSEHSRENLFRWLQDKNITIYPDGFIYGYKGVKIVDGEYRSISSGTAYVDGVRHTGYIPNPLGAVVTMPRSEVTNDPGVGCHVGLHVGNYGYASSFAQGALLEVKVDPASVVSVPTDCGDQKMRVCQYTVMSVIDREYSSPLYLEDDEDEEDWADTCSECASDLKYYEEGTCEDCLERIEEEEEEYDDEDEDTPIYSLMKRETPTSFKTNS